jgi:anthranilate synthase/aminodeoxychorismate synthase-like glutamine amidotransferase
VARQGAVHRLRGAASRSAVEPALEVLLSSRGHRYEFERLMPPHSAHAAGPQPQRLAALWNAQLQGKARRWPLRFGEGFHERTALGDVECATQVGVAAQKLVEEQVGVAAIHAAPLAVTEGLAGRSIHATRLARPLGRLEIPCESSPAPRGPIPVTCSILVLDNYDSFTYNLVQLLGRLGAECRVVSNDDPTLPGARSSTFWHARGVVISAGPGRPTDAGGSLQMIADAAGVVPILGLCLGHQAIAEHFGGRIVRAHTPLHGKAAAVLHDGRTVFRGLPARFEAARYNSLVVARDSMPTCLEISAESDAGEVMAVRHRTLPIEGVQFHPESILSSEGPRIIGNWLESL